MDWYHLLRVVLLLAFFGLVLWACARIGGVTKEDFKRIDQS